VFQAWLIICNAPNGRIRTLTPAGSGSSTPEPGERKS
jgi:hypothetical protein